MSRHEFATVSLRLIGLVCLLLSVPRFVSQSAALVETLNWLHWQVQHVWANLSGAHNNFGFSFGELIVGGLQVAFGLYCFLSGRWVVQRLLRGLDDDHHCAHCGYDLSGCKPGETLCPECGHSFRRRP